MIASIRCRHFTDPVIVFCLAVLCAVGAARLNAESRIRYEVVFPDLPGYLTLKCDFHMHTVFSDGQVWPTIRVEEAWRDGLDVIAITDHNEYRPYQDDLTPKAGRSYELARPAAEGLGLLLIRGCEITRDEPPGHLNALFLQDIAAVRRDDSRAAVKSAAEQGAFIFWNHPAWKQPEGQAVWYDLQEEFLRNGWLKGVEIVNGNDYDPVVHGWAVNKSLTIMGDSDIHAVIDWEYERSRGRLRPMTLVFATAKTEIAVKEALLARRTVVFSCGRLYGDASLLRPLVQQSIELLTPVVVLHGGSQAIVQLRNRSAAPLRIEFTQAVAGITTPRKLDLDPQAITAFDLGLLADTKAGVRMLALACQVTNALTAPNQPLTIDLQLQVRVEP
ncbi:MAG: Sb-PDE family phosphodiesterase [Opitutaceae bacterium]|nr:Sb-PDE family phosphodiesterase [Opitutaceae bacterium]